ncbi:MAG: NfeD family protein [Marinobacter sp.]|uniref:NfeD family protein n=1 Tax=Marinobacter sp. TaxID=50741 RepID=UPI00299E8490|nr:NfeD family protein [Marinobacter sp.]MDX1634257.1 NfeD family protein [Marinobacter sp.]
MSTAVKYILLQIPAAVLVALLLIFLHREGWVDLTWTLVVMAGWLLKDALLYPFYRRALEGAPPQGMAALVGETATCLTPVDRRGLVRLRGEHWQARSVDGDTLAVGRRVRVVSHQGRVLLVKPE